MLELMRDLSVKREQQARRASHGTRVSCLYAVERTLRRLLLLASLSEVAVY